jgi:hypothetical protein
MPLYPERRRSSAPDDLQELRRQDETRRIADLGHSSDGPSCLPRRDSRQQNGITVRSLSQPTSATKSALLRVFDFSFFQVGPGVELKL